MQSQVAVQAALSSDILRSNSRSFTTNVDLHQEDSDSDNDDDAAPGSGGCGNRRSPTLRELGRRVITRNSKEGGVHTRMVLESALQKLDRRRDKEHGGFISEVLGNAALMAKTTKALRSVRDPLFAAKDFDRMALFSVITRVLHEMKITVASTCWDQTVLRCKEELNDQHVKYESMRRVFQDSREAYLKEVAALRDQVRMRGDLSRLDDDNMPSMDIVSYFDPEYVMLPGEQKFLLDAVKEKIRMMIERNPKLECCVDFGQLDRLQTRVDSNDLQDTKIALQNALARLKEAEATIAKKIKKEDAAAAKGVVAAPSASASEKVIEALEDQIQKLREKLSSEEVALKSAKRTVLALEGERDDLSQSVRNLSTEQIIHKTELNRLQERLSHYEPLARDAEAEIARLQELVQAQEAQIKKLSGQAHEDIHFPDEGLLSPADAAAGARRESASDKINAEKLKRAQDERDVALARCDDLSKKCDQMREAVRGEVEHFLELKSDAILDGADSMMEQAELLGCVNMEGVSEGARVCECGNVLAQDSLFCRKCGTKWQKAATSSKELFVSKDTLVALTAQLNDADQKLDAAKTELKEALESQEGQAHDDIDDDVEWLEKLMRIQNEVDAHQRQKLRLEAMILEARVRLANRAALEMPISENNHCTCSCSEELRATRKLLERTQLLCTESTTSLQRIARENSVASATLNKMRDTLGEAAGAAERIAADAPDMRLVLKALNEARAHSVFNRLYQNRDESTRKASKDARKCRMMEDAFKAIYQLDDNEKDNRAGQLSPLCLSLEKHGLTKGAAVAPKSRTEVRKQTGKKFLVISPNHPHPEPESRASDTRCSTPERLCHLRRTPSSLRSSASNTRCNSPEEPMLRVVALQTSAANTRCNSPEEPVLRGTALPPLRGQQSSKHQSLPCAGGQVNGVLIVPPDGRPDNTRKFHRKRTCPM